MGPINVLGIITARGGSKRIPLKNLKFLNGVPLIAYTVKAALQSHCLERLIVSTDHEEIAEASRHLGAEVPFIRPSELASGSARSEEAILHAVQFCENQAGGRPIEIVVTIQPTTPFLQAEDIDSCVGMLRSDQSLDSVVTVTDVSTRPEWMYKEENGCLRNIMGEPFSGASQLLPELVVMNGGAYATRRRTLFEKRSLVGSRIRGHLMERIRSIDIDDDIDWKVAELFGRTLQQEDE